MLEDAPKETRPRNFQKFVRPVSVPGTHRDYGILSPPETRLSFHLNLGASPLFVASTGILSQAGGSVSEVEFAVMIEAKGARKMLHSGAVGDIAGKWRKVSIDLRPWARQDVVLVLRTRSPVDSSEPVAAVWNRPRLLEVLPIRDRLSRLRDDVRKLGRRGMKHALLATMKGQLAIEDQRTLYRLWTKKHELKDGDLRDISEQVQGFSYRPTISIITPVYNTHPEWLRICIESVRNQLYPHWELCLSDDASTEAHVGSILREYARLDRRIKIVFQKLIAEFHTRRTVH